MANLETLELTISANAQGASQGIGQLTSSLSSLSTAVSKSVGNLQKLNAELKTLKGFGALKLPNLGEITGAKRVVSSSRKTAEELKAWQNEIKTTYSNGLGFTKGFETEAERRAKNPQWYWDEPETNKKVKENILAQNEILKAQEEAKRVAQETTESVKEQTESIKESTQTIQESPATFQKLKQGFTGFTEGASKFFSKVKRIATTMLIRSAIRGLIKSIKEGVNNLYEWSRMNNGEFAKSLDTLKSKSQQLKNSIGASIAPVLQAAIPVINAVASAAITAFNAVNQLIALLTGKSSWTRATEGANNFADAAKGAGGAAQEWLAAWDELNVMSSGGGGGGGGSAIDYSTMFEEVYNFDKGIREVSEFVKANFEAIRDLAIATGATMLAWKLGNSFMEALPTLSALMGYVATVGAVAVTIGFTWLFGNQYMQSGNDGWLIAEALTAGIGSVAAWTIARKLIGGQAGTYAFAITLAFSAVTGIIANIANVDVDALSETSIKQSLLDALKMGAAAGVILKAAGVLSGGWALLAAGGVALVTFGIVVGLKILTQKKDVQVDPSLITLTDEQCKAYVKSKMFTVNPDITLDVLKSNITLNDTAEAELTEAITSTIGTLNVINLGLANDNDYATIKDQILGENGLIAKDNGWIDSAEATSKLVLKFTPEIVGSTEEEQGAWYTSNIEGWETVKDFMNNLGKELADEIVKGENNELIIKRPERVNTLLNEIARISEIVAGSDVATEAQIDLEIGLQDLDSSSFNSVMKYFSDYKKQMNDAALEIAKTAEANQIRLVNALKLMLDVDPDNADLKAKLKEAEEGLAKIKRDFQSKVDKTMKELTAPGISLLQEWVNANFKPGSIEFDEVWLSNFAIHTSNKFEELVKEAFFWNDIDIRELDIKDFIEVGGWDLLSKELQNNIIKYARMDSTTIALLAKCKVPAEKIIEVVGWNDLKDDARKDFIAAMIGAFGTNDAIAAIHKALPAVSATTLIRMSGWSDFTLAQKYEFINAIKNAFGADAAKTAAKNAGINLGELVAQGMKSKDPEIKKQADEWAKIIKGETESKPPVIKPAVAQGAIDGIKKTIEGIKPQVTANVSATGVSALSTSIKRALSGKITLSGGGGNIATVTMTARKEGGFVGSGDLFLANENGVPELIGTFGNQTAVANTEQIVAGISKGVSDANAEQNALLRQQNSLLASILNKDTSVRIGASAALGRVAKQSIDMYGALVGG